MIFSLDLGTKVGFAFGPAEAVPQSGTVILKRPNEHRSIALSNLMAWLHEEWSRSRPDLVVKEAPMPLQAFRDRGNSEAGVLMAYGLHGIVEAMSRRFGIRLEQAHPSTIRKHFIGRGRLGARSETKGAVIQRCHVLGLMPRDCRDEDRADAIASWDWASATFGQRSASKLYLFGEKVRPASASGPSVPAAADRTPGSAQSAAAINPLPPTGEEVTSAADGGSSRSERHHPLPDTRPRLPNGANAAQVRAT
jgi:hypothetical protein